MSIILLTLLYLSIGCLIVQIYYIHLNIKLGLSCIMGLSWGLHIFLLPMYATIALGNILEVYNSQKITPPLHGVVEVPQIFEDIQIAIQIEKYRNISILCNSSESIYTTLCECYDNYENAKNKIDRFLDNNELSGCLLR